MFRQAKQPRQTNHVCVGDYSGFAECVAEYEIGGFAANAGQGRELLTGVGHLAPESLDNLRAGGFDVLCLVAEETCASDVLFEFGYGSLGKTSGTAELPEKIPTNYIDACVRALG